MDKSEQTGAKQRKWAGSLARGIHEALRSGLRQNNTVTRESKGMVRTEEYVSEENNQILRKMRAGRE